MSVARQAPDADPGSPSADAHLRSLHALVWLLRQFGHQVDVSDIASHFDSTTSELDATAVRSLLASFSLESHEFQVDPARLRRAASPALVQRRDGGYDVLWRSFPGFVVLFESARGRRVTSARDAGATYTGFGFEISADTLADLHATGRPPGFLRMLTCVSGLRGVVFGLVALSLILQVFALATPLLIQTAIDQAATANDRHFLLLLGSGLAAVVLLQALLAAARSWIAHRFSVWLDFRWNSGSIRHLLRLPMHFLEQKAAGDLLARFGSLTALQAATTSLVTSVLLDGLMAVTTLVVMVAYSPILAIASVLATAVYALLRVATYGFFERANEAEVLCSARQHAFLVDTVHGLATVKSSGAAVVRHARWQKLAIGTLAQRLRVGKLAIRLTLASQLLMGAEALVVTIAGVDMLMDGSFSIGMFVAYLFYKDQFTSRASSFVNTVVSMRLLDAHAGRIGDLLMHEPEPDGSGRMPGDARSASLDVHGLVFGYPGGDAHLIDGCSFRLAPGEIVALTGRSGCGKTTLLKLLLGLRQPKSGQVLVDGEDIALLGPASRRHLLAAAMQGDRVFGATVAENVALADAEPDPQRVRQACDLVGLLEEIQEFPGGIDTLVGEGGVEFSHGQKQRLVIARALYLRPRVLLLDEATSNLDRANELRVSDSIRKSGITTLIIAHRQETIDAADRVLVLERGRIRSSAEVAPVEPARL